MTMAKGASPRAPRARLALLLIGAGLLAGCQSASQAPSAEARAVDWQVIERLGDARYLAPGTDTWAAAMPATTLPGGSRVVTGAGGRLILARGGDHVTAGPASRFSLPAAASGSLGQAAGRLRYRLAGPATFAVETPLLEIEVQDADFDVELTTAAASVVVERGRLRAATPDGLREIRLEAGQSAEAGGQQALAFRRAAGRPLERVERIVLPALQPKPGVAEGAARPQPMAADASRAATSAAAVVRSAVAVAATDPTTGVTRPAAVSRTLATLPATAEATFTTTAAGAVRPERTVAVTDARLAAAPLDDPIAQPAIDPSVEDQGPLFDRLTVGMVDGVSVTPSPKGPSNHGRAR